MTSATDNRTTELRRLLDERGVEYEETTEYVTTAYLGDKVIRYYGYDGDFSVEVIFPRPYLNNTEWLTPEQAISATLGDDGYRQAAEYWKGMYEELLTERIGDERDYPVHDGRYECPDCGNVVYYDELHGGGLTIYVEDYQIPFNCCPNCGKAVKR